MSEGSGAHVFAWVPCASAKKSEANFHGISKSSRRKRFSLQPYDDELVKSNNLHYPPAKISELLCIQHGLDPMFVNQKAVESQLQNIKKNSLKTLVPTNNIDTLHATDDPDALCK